MDQQIPSCLHMQSWEGRGPVTQISLEPLKTFEVGVGDVIIWSQFLSSYQ